MTDEIESKVVITELFKKGKKKRRSTTSTTRRHFVDFIFENKDLFTDCCTGKDFIDVSVQLFEAHYPNETAPKFFVGQLLRWGITRKTKGDSVEYVWNDPPSGHSFTPEEFIASPSLGNSVQLRKPSDDEAKTGPTAE
jgi:hypothetical protein